jgi:hypothetical protein
MASFAVNRSYQISALQMHHEESTHLMVVSQQLIQEINSLVADKSLVLGVDKTMPVLLREST